MLVRGRILLRFVVDKGKRLGFSVIMDLWKEKRLTTFEHQAK